MASRVATGAITLLDVADGVNPLAVTLGNQSHTFSANEEGTVTNSERGLFSSETFVYVGATRATYDSSASPAINTYKITNKVVTSNWGVTQTITGGQAFITCSSTPQNSTNRTGTAVLSIAITNAVGNVTPVEVTISWSVMVEGADGSAVYIVPSRLTFQYEETGTTTTDGDITLDISYAGNLGSLSADYALNGSTSWTPLLVGTGADKASVIDINGTGSNDKIVITPANFSNSAVLSIRVKGDNGGSDVVSIIKINDGVTGKASLFVSITSSNAGFVFKNNTGLVKELTAKVTDMADGSEITTGITYRWQKNGVNFGGTLKTQEVNASDVEDNGSDQFQCNVTVTD
jgi:hypothetical protein